MQMHCTQTCFVQLISEIKFSGQGLWQLMAALYRCEASTQKSCHPMGKFSFIRQYVVMEAPFMLGTRSVITIVPSAIRWWVVFQQ